MSVEDEVEVLRRVPMFAKFDTAKLKLMAFASERVTFEAGQTLFRQGDVGDAAYVILEGTTDVIVEGSGEPVTVASMERDYIVGEIAVLIDVPRTATVVATSRLTTLKLTKELFFQLIEDFPEVALEVIRVLAAYAEQGAVALAKRQGMASPGNAPPR